MPSLDRVSFAQRPHAQLSDELTPTVNENVSVLSNLSADIRCAAVKLGCPAFR
jgi:hypothetical protein